MAERLFDRTIFNNSIWIQMTVSCVFTFFLSAVLIILHWKIASTSLIYSFHSTPNHRCFVLVHFQSWKLAIITVEKQVHLLCFGCICCITFNVTCNVITNPLLTQSINIVNTPVTLLFSKKWVPGLTTGDNTNILSTLGSTRGIYKGFFSQA